MTTATKSKPILMNAEMVRATLRGDKTQTRRIVKPQPENTGPGWENGADLYQWNSGRGDWFAGCPREQLVSDKGLLFPSRCPYRVGDKLWVRETFSLSSEGFPFEGKYGRWCDGPGEHWYRADNNRPTWAECKWRPSIFMPRNLSRITLSITDVRVERLNDISEEDAIAEGLDRYNFTGYGDEPGIPSFPEPTVYRCPGTDRSWSEYAIGEFKHLWESIHGDGSWELNPWLWCVSFQKVEE